MRDLRDGRTIRPRAAGVKKSPPTLATLLPPSLPRAALGPVEVACTVAGVRRQRRDETEGALGADEIAQLPAAERRQPRGLAPHPRDPGHEPLGPDLLEVAHRL